MPDQQSYYIIKDREQSAVAEAFRALRINIANALGEERSVMFAGLNKGEGSAMTAVNTAAALAYAGKRVILVDGDLRNSYLQDVFGVTGPGLTSVISGGLELDKVLRDTSIPNLSVLTSGYLPEKPIEILSHPMLREIIAELKRRADYVIFTSSPIVIVNRTIVSDACVLASKVDGVVVVADAEAVLVNGARKALALLNGARAHILGTVLNDVRDDHSFVY